MDVNETERKEATRRRNVDVHLVALPDRGALLVFYVLIRLQHAARELHDFATLDEPQKPLLDVEVP